MDKKVRYGQDCYKLAFRIYGKSYDDLDDKQASTISRLAKGRTRFNFVQFLTQLLTGNQ